MNVPAELRYSTDHEWVRVDGDRIVIGITDYAQDALGDVVFVEMPAVGDELASGGSFGEVESTKSVSDLFAPVAGVVVEVNDALNANPELINEDPYGEGWVLALTPANAEDVDALLDAEAYTALTES